MKASEFLHMAGLMGKRGTLRFDQVEYLLTRFAKYHVKKALEAVGENAKVVMVLNCDDHTPYYGACVSCGRTDNPQIPTTEIDVNSIIDAYPLTNIQ